MIRLASLALVISLWLAATPARAPAQSSPTDTAAVLLQVAHDLYARGELDLAEAILDLLLERYRASEHEDAARTLLATIREPREERAGRTQLVAWNTVFGSWLGIAIPLAFDANDPEVFGAGLLILGPAGFMASRWYANNHRMTSAQAAAATFGSMWGTWQAMGWRDVLDIGDRSVDGCYDGFCYPYQERSETAPYVAAVLGGISGLVVAPYLAGRANMEPGVMTTISHGAYWGSWFGLASGIIANAEDDALRTWTLLGGNAGLIGTAIIGPKLQLSTGQVWLTTAGGIAGLVAGLGVDLLVQPDGQEAAIAIPAAGSAIGLFLGWNTARDRAVNMDVRTGGALVEMEGGRVSIGLPTPQPGFAVAFDRMGRQTRRPTARLQLFSSSF